MLAAKYRIPKDEILPVIRNGTKLYAGDFDLRFVVDNNTLLHSLFAFVVPKKVHKSSVFRNTIKRKFRAAVFNLLKENKLPKGKYVFLIRNAEIESMKSNEIEENISNLAIK